MHNIHYAIYDEKVSKAVVMADIREHAEQDGDGYASRFTWHDNTAPFESYEKAKEFIDAVDRNWYDDHAVKFKDYSGIKSTKIDEYEAKIAELTKAQAEYIKSHSVKTFQAEFIGCKKCGSKLSKNYLHADQCPLCRSDLRSQTTLDKIKWYHDKIIDYRKRVDAEQKKQSSKAKIKWLVKYEYHS